MDVKCVVVDNGGSLTFATINSDDVVREVDENTLTVNPYDALQVMRTALLDSVVGKKRKEEVRKLLDGICTLRFRQGMDAMKFD